MMACNRSWSESSTELVKDTMVSERLPEHREVASHEVESEYSVHSSLADVSELAMILTELSLCLPRPDQLEMQGSSKPMV